MAVELPSLSDIEALVRRVLREELGQAAAPASVLTTEQAEERPRHQAVRPAGVGGDRYFLLKVNAGRCEACGWVPPPTPRGMSILNAHHVIPAAAGGGEGENLAVLCPNCHAVAHALTFVGWKGERYIGPGTRERLFDFLRRLRADPDRFFQEEADFLRDLRFARTGDII